LPGNPVSALVTAQVLIKPALKKLAGLADPFWPRFGVPLTRDLPANGMRRHYLRGKLSRSEIGFLEVTPFEQTDSSHGSSLALADVLIVQPEDDPGRPAGEIVEVIPLDW
jgi:molybdopterin molybdotransferase